MLFHRSIRGSLALFGVAIGLIGTAGAATAQEADSTVVEFSAQAEDAQIGDSLVIDRPAPRRNPSSELGAEPPASIAPAVAPSPAPATVVVPSGGGAVPPPVVVAPPAPSARFVPDRPTIVQGVQIQRSSSRPLETASLARTGVDNHVLVLVAGSLLVLGCVLIRFGRPRRII